MSEASIIKWSAEELVSGLSGASERTKRATEWPVKNVIVTSRNRPYRIEIISIHECPKNSSG